MAEGGPMGQSARDQEITELYSEDSEDIKIKKERSEEFKMSLGDDVDSEYFSGKS